MCVKLKLFITSCETRIFLRYVISYFLAKLLCSKAQCKCPICCPGLHELPLLRSRSGWYSLLSSLGVPRVEGRRKGREQRLQDWGKELKFQELLVIEHRSTAVLPIAQPTLNLNLQGWVTVLWYSRVHFLSCSLPFSQPLKFKIFMILVEESSTSISGARLTLTVAKFWLSVKMFWQVVSWVRAWTSVMIWVAVWLWLACHIQTSSHQNSRRRWTTWMLML